LKHRCPDPLFFQTGAHGGNSPLKGRRIKEPAKELYIGLAVGHGQADGRTDPARDDQDGPKLAQFRMIIHGIEVDRDMVTF
jgi:hypothetical protein